MKIWSQLCVSSAILFVLAASQSTTLSWKEKVRLQNKLNYDKYILHINRASPSAEPPSTATNDVLLSNNVEPSNRNSIGSEGADTVQGEVVVQPSNPPPPPPPPTRPPPPPTRPPTAAPQPPPPRPTVYVPPSTRPPPPRTTAYVPPSTRPQPPPTPATIAVRSDIPSPPPQPRPQPRPQPVFPGATSFASSSASAGGASSFASAGAGSSFSSAGSSAGASASAGSFAGSATPVRKSPVALLGQVVSGIVRPITSILPAPLGPKGKNPGIVGSVVTSLLDDLEGNLRVIYPGTLWCGAGNAARRQDEVGIFKGTDKCCRAHDSCKDSIGAGMTGHGLTNSGTFTRSHCDCDEAFYSCLKRDGSLVSLKVGTTYFNILQPKCFRQTGCTGNTNSTCTGDWRWFNNRLF